MKFFKKENKSKLMLFIVDELILYISIFPPYQILVASLEAQMEIFQIPTPFWPRNLALAAYVKQVTSSSDTLQGSRNSVIISVGIMLIATALSIPATHGLARSRFRVRKIIVLPSLIIQMLPSTPILTLPYITFSDINLLNNYWTPILAGATIGIPFSIIILRTYFISIPKEPDEVAKIDSCGYFSTFSRIMLPIAKSGIVVATIFSFTYAWGDLTYGITFIIDLTMQPITSSIYNYVQQYRTLWNSTTVSGVIAISPVIAIFIFMQQYIVSGLTNGVVRAREGSFLCLNKGFKRCLPGTAQFTMLFGVLVSIW